MRKLASIQTISSITPIEGKQKIVLATIQGWQVIVKADELTIGSKCVFYEIDSFLPIKPEYAFLGKNTTFLGKPGYRIKTMKMAGVLSQGLALPLSHVGLQDLPVDTDVTDLLEVIDTVFEETLKLDGSSLTAYKLAPKPTWWQKLFRLTPKPHFGVCSRNQELKRPDNLSSSAFWYAADKYHLSSMPEGFAIQGELVGPNIQSNHEKVSDFEFYCFDVFDIKSQKYLTATERHLFCTRFNIPHVPVVGMTKVLADHPSIDELLERVDDRSMNPNTISEGRVYKSTTNPAITFKVINNRYLLKEK